MMERLSASIGLRASTFDELTSLLAACELREDVTDLSEAEEWWLTTTSHKLYTALATSEYGSGAGVVSSLASIRATLLKQLQFERRGGDLPAISDYHGEWLSTFEAALAALGRSEPDLTPSESLLELATRPFSQLIKVTLAEGLEALADELRVADDVLIQLAAEPVRRFRLGIGGALEAELKVRAAKCNALDGGAAPTPDIDPSRLFRSKADFTRFFTQFPVLARWLSLCASQAILNSQLLFSRLIADRELLGLAHAGPICIAAIELGKSDPHCGGNSVSILQLRGPCGSTKVVYKPRSVAAERTWNEILETVSLGAGLNLPRYAVYDRDGYGWCEYLPHGLNEVDSRSDVAAIYSQLGAYLGLFYLLGGTDLHLENVLISAANAYVVDCETLLGVPVLGALAGAGTLADSVYRTGLLEWPGAVAGASAPRKLSGIGGGGSYTSTDPIPLVKGEADPTALRVELERDVEIDLGLSNRIFCCGQLVDPADFVPQMTTGFETICRFLSTSPGVVDSLETALAEVKVRFINRATESYTRALRAAQHPRCLMDPLEVDLMFKLFSANQKRYDLSGRIAREEVRQLWRADVPYFLSNANSRDVVSGFGELVHRTPITPLEAGIQRIKRLDARCLEQQARYIKGGFGKGEPRELQAVLLSYAERIGELLSIKDGSVDQQWLAYQFDRSGRRRVPVDFSLYDGSAGIGLFFAYLNHFAPRPSFKASSDVALAHALASGATTNVGAFRGLGSKLYLLTHLGQLWRSDELAQKAARVIAQIGEYIERDREYDILMGAAGALKCLLAAESVADTALDVAQRCGEHLLRHASTTGATVSWPPSDPSIATANLTGFAHGAAGVGCALIHLGDRLAEPNSSRLGWRPMATKRCTSIRTLETGSICGARLP